LTSPSYAHRADPSDRPFWIKSLKYEYDIKKDGTFSVIEERIIHIENESGRNSQSVQNLLFRPLNEKIELLQAYTRTRGKKIPVDKQNISIESGGNNRPGFDAENKMIIAFPQVEIGSDIYMQIKSVTFSVPEPDVFSEFINLFWPYLKEFQLTIRSDLPLYQVLFDPQGQFKSSKDVVKDRHIYELWNTRPLITATTDEDHVFTASETLPSITYSSIQTWDHFAVKTNSELTKMLKEKPPKDLEEIKNKVRRIQNRAEQVNQLTALISEKIRYFGDWRRVRGDLLPRTLKEITASSYGDCKDLAFVTAVLLKALGYQADVAWVLRWTVPPLRSSYQLPAMFFNHAVVRAEKEGEIFWVDATNLISQAPYTPSDISGRPAFVLGPEPHLDWIPEVSPTDAKYFEGTTLMSKDGLGAKLVGHVEYSGLAAVNEWQNRWNKSAKDYDFDFIASLRRNSVLVSQKLSKLEDRTRVLKNFTRDYDADFTQFWVRSSAGPTVELPLQSVFSVLFSMEVADRASDLYLGIPYSYHSTTQIKNRKLLGDNSFKCNLTSKWLDFRRQVQTLLSDIQVETTYEINRRYITNKELQSKDFKEFQRQLRECFSHRLLVFEK
jgi:transglutaminase-like putative cysteine protease